MLCFSQFSDKTMNGLMEKLLVARLEQFAVANMSFRSI